MTQHECPNYQIVIPALSSPAKAGPIKITASGGIPSVGGTFGGDRIHVLN